MLRTILIIILVLDRKPARLAVQRGLGLLSERRTGTSADHSPGSRVYGPLGHLSRVHPNLAQ
jgi:hypothetical protein